MNSKIENKKDESRPFAFISYRNAAEYMHNKLILCNNIVDIDGSIWDNCNLYNAEQDFYQYFLTDCSQDDAERLHRWFGLTLIYAERLGLYVLAVDHWGTNWDYVPCPVFNQNVADYVKNNGLEFKH